MKLITTSILVFTLAGCASMKEYADEVTMVGDMGTTVAASMLPQVVELNPLGWFTIPLKLYAYQTAKNQEPKYCRTVLTWYGTQWGALSGWGWGLIAGAGTGGAAVAALGVGGLAWWALDSGGAEKSCRNASPRTKEEWNKIWKSVNESQAVWLDH